MPNNAADLFCHLDEVYDPYRAPKDAMEGKQEVQEYDDDMMGAEDKQNIDNEMANHLARQDGAPTQDASKAQAAFIDEGDSSEELQSEFRAQMRRQAGSKADTATEQKDTTRGEFHKEAPQPAEGEGAKVGEKSPGW